MRLDLHSLIRVHYDDRTNPTKFIFLTSLPEEEAFLDEWPGTSTLLRVLRGICEMSNLHCDTIPTNIFHSDAYKPFPYYFYLTNKHLKLPFTDEDIRSTYSTYAKNYLFNKQ